MKYTLLTTFILIGLATAGLADEPQPTAADTKNNARPIYLGIQGGVNFSKLKVDTTPSVTTNSKLNALGGVRADIPISELISIQPELNYLTYGYHYKTGNTDVSAKYSYFELPVFAKFSFLNGSFHPLVLAGASIGFLSQASAETATTTTVTTKTTPDIKSQTNSTNFSLKVGVGFDWQFTSFFGFYLNSRYSHGLTNISTSSTKVTTTAIEIISGFSFRL